jgi:hypothetical protein
MPSAGTWVPFFGVQHRQIRALAAALRPLGLPAHFESWAALVPSLLNLYCLHWQEDGELAHLSEREIAEICEWPYRRKAVEFVAALVATGFLEEGQGADGRSLRVHNYKHYCRRILSDRERWRERVQSGAVRGGSKERSKPAVAECSTERRAGAPRSAPAQPYLTLPTSLKTVVNDPPTPPAPVENFGTATAAAAPPSPVEVQEPHGNGQDTAGQASSGTPDPIWRRWCVFANCLRAGGWADQDVRRMVEWARRTRGGAYLGADEQVFLRWLGFARQVRDYIAQGGRVADAVRYWIHCVELVTARLADEHRKAAYAAWDAEDARGGLEAPAWLSEYVANCGALPAGVAGLGSGINEAAAAAKKAAALKALNGTATTR